MKCILVLVEMEMPKTCRKQKKLILPTRKSTRIKKKTEFFKSVQ